MIRIRSRVTVSKLGLKLESDTSDSSFSAQQQEREREILIALSISLSFAPVQESIEEPSNTFRNPVSDKCQAGRPDFTRATSRPPHSWAGLLTTPKDKHCLKASRDPEASFEVVL